MGNLRDCAERGEQGLGTYGPNPKLKTQKDQGGRVTVMLLSMPMLFFTGATCPKQCRESDHISASRAENLQPLDV